LKTPFAGSRAPKLAKKRPLLQPALDELDTSGVDSELVLSDSERVNQAAYDLVTAGNMDFVVVGSKGTARVPSALLGGVGEQVIAGSAAALAVKKKGETARFPEVLPGAGD
jgi:nucleotide-binding universal stress UspA family protein